MKIQKSDIDINVITSIVDIINKGLSAEVKREKNNIVVVELKRKAIIKSQVKEIIIGNIANDNEQGSSKNTKE